MQIKAVKFGPGRAVGGYPARVTLWRVLSQRAVVDAGVRRLESMWLLSLSPRGPALYARALVFPHFLQSRFPWHLRDAARCMAISSLCSIWCVPFPVPGVAITQGG